MILENKGDEFKLKFDNKPFTIPAGKFDVSRALGAHIIAVVNKPGWVDYNVVVVSSAAQEEIKPAIEPVVEEPKEEVTEEPLVGEKVGGKEEAQVKGKGKK